MKNSNYTREIEYLVRTTMAATIDIYVSCMHIKYIFVLVDRDNVEKFPGRSRKVGHPRCRQLLIK